jgi:hypothetical protein
MDSAPQNTFTCGDNYKEDCLPRLLKENTNANTVLSRFSSRFPPLYGTSIDHNFGAAKANDVTSITLAKESRWNSAGVILIENQGQEVTTEILDENLNERYRQNIYNSSSARIPLSRIYKHKRRKAAVQRSASDASNNHESKREVCQCIDLRQTISP